MEGGRWKVGYDWLPLLERGDPMLGADLGSKR